MKIEMKVKVTLSADEWDLYTTSMKCGNAAKGLNAAASKALSCGDSDEAYRIFREAQLAWADYGAYDSEPSWVFAKLHQRVFGGDDV